MGGSKVKIGQQLRDIGYLIGGMVLLGSLFGASVASAATYYVAATGNDASPGTEAAPFRTLNRGVQGLSPGDTLYIKSGTYAESLENTIPGGTSWSSPVTVAAAPGETVTLRPASGPYVVSFVGASKQYIVVRGLILDSANVGSYGVIFYGDQGGSGGTFPHHIRLADSEIKNSRLSGVMVFTGSNYHEFLNLKVHDNGSEKGHGLYIASSNNLVEKCAVYRNAGFGVHVYSSKYTGMTNNNIVQNNQVYENVQLRSSGAGIILSSGSGNLASNNLVWGNQDGIVVALNGVSQAKVYNNTVYANRRYGIKIGSASQTKVQNNIIYGNGGHAIENKGSDTLLTNNLLNVDPKLVNAGEQGFPAAGQQPRH
jgi:parallel beta-helix repeat protein